MQNPCLVMFKKQIKVKVRVSRELRKGGWFTTTFRKGTKIFAELAGDERKVDLRIMDEITREVIGVIYSVRRTLIKEVI